MNTVIETSSGQVSIDSASMLENGCTALISLYGQTQFAKLMGGALITDDGEAVEGITVQANGGARAEHFLFCRSGHTAALAYEARDAFAALYDALFRSAHGEVSKSKKQGHFRGMEQ